MNREPNEYPRNLGDADGQLRYEDEQAHRNTRFNEARGMTIRQRWEALEYAAEWFKQERQECADRRGGLDLLLGEEMVAEQAQVALRAEAQRLRDIIKRARERTDD